VAGQIRGAWDAVVAARWGIVLLAVWAATTWPLFWRLVDALDSNARLDEILSLQLALFGSVALVCGIYLAVLELRARTSVPKAVKSLKTALVDPKELADAIAKLLEAFGKLTPSSAFVVTALGLFGGAAALAWS
jgi:hypothetical protein